MNIRPRIGKLETTVGRWVSLQELSDAELEAKIRKAAGLGDDDELTEDLLHALSVRGPAALVGAHA
jgi:hypothetical protein